MEKIVGIRLSLFLKHWHLLQKNIVGGDHQEWPLEIIALVREITLVQLLEIFQKVLLCVGYLHQRGYVHRDIKSQNIIIGTNMQPYIIDFGLSSEFNEVKIPGGTRGYLDPRILDPAPLAEKNKQSDIYALGMILLEIIAFRYIENSGKLRFSPYDMSISQDNLAEFLEKAKESYIKLPLLQEISKEIYDRKGMCSICQACLGTDNSGRHLPLWKEINGHFQRIDLQYKTPEQIAIDLQNLLEDRPIIARPSTIWTTIGKWLRRNRTLVVAFFIALWFTLTGITWFLFSLQKVNSQLKTAVAELEQTNQLLNTSLIKEKKAGQKATQAQLQEKEAHQKVREIIYRLSIGLPASIS